MRPNQIEIEAFELPLEAHRPDFPERVNAFALVTHRRLKQLHPTFHRAEHRRLTAAVQMMLNGLYDLGALPDDRPRPA